MGRTRKPVRWALQDAKNRFSEVVDAALLGNPQVVTRRGVETAVIVSYDDYARMSAYRTDPKPSLAEYLLGGPELDEIDPFERINLRSRRQS